MTRVEVDASRRYTVWIGAGLLQNAGEMISKACGGVAGAGDGVGAACGGAAGAAMLVTDDIVGALYGDKAENSLRAAGYRTSRFTFPNGERSKNMDTYTALLRALAGANLTRSDVVVALGGGVVGDMAGFAAATWLRGVAFAQIPTTLLAMVDSSVGGKTAIDLPEGKNQVGAFHQPGVVLCDIDTLDTLPAGIFDDGCAEMIKHGAILSAELFGLLKEPVSGRMEDIIARNVKIKGDIVNADERDNGERQILNFGHTIGHGVEKCSGYAVSHGRAVAIGMSVVSRGAARMGFCDIDCHREIVEAVTRYRLPHETDIGAESLVEAAAFDKKRSGGRITLILPERIGKCTAREFEPGAFAELVRLGAD